MKYIDYYTLDEFYPIPSLCELLELDKTALRAKCEKYSIQPRKNEIGEWGLVKYDVRKLHNALYHEDNSNRNDNPWA